MKRSDYISGKKQRKEIAVTHSVFRIDEYGSKRPSCNKKKSKKLKYVAGEELPTCEGCLSHLKIMGITR